MATTTRWAIRTPDAGDVPDVPTDLAEMGGDIDAILLGWSADTFANRPAAGTSGRLFYATDTTALYYDNGSSWVHLLRSGGTLSSFLDWARNELRKALLVDYTEKVNVVAASGSNRTLDLATAPVHKVTLDQACTFTFAGARNGEASVLTLQLINDATGRAVTWPGSVRWPEGDAPDVTAASSIHWLTFISLDGGANWDGFPGGLNFS